jgi:DNA-binding transcriptional MerR regulator
LDLVYENEGELNSSTEEREERTIRGKALYFSTSQVANILDIADSKVRYYTKEFDSLFDEGDITISNTQRRYTQKSIDKLKYFIELKNDGLTIKQIKEYCEEVEWDEDRGIVVKESTPLHVQMIATALMEEQSKHLTALKENFTNQMLQMMKFQAEQNEKLKTQLKEELALTVDEVISEKLNEHLSKIDAELSVTKDTNEKIDKLRESMEHRKEESEKEQKKGILGWFSKRKE